LEDQAQPEQSVPDLWHTDHEQGKRLPDTREGDMTKFYQTTLQAIRSHTCLECGAAEAAPYKDDVIPYCSDCKKRHADKRRKDKEAE